MAMERDPVEDGGAQRARPAQTFLPRSGIDRLPPHDLAAEEAVIASLMVSEHAIVDVAPFLKPRDFFREKNAWIYEACLDLWNRSEPVNQVTVAHELARKGRLEDVGGIAYLSRLTTELPSPVGVEHYGRIVQRDSVYRRLIDAADRIARLGYEGGPSLEEALNRAEALLVALRSGDVIRDFIPLRDLLERFLEEATPFTAPSSTEGGIRTGFMKLDELLGGLKRSDLIILAARPGLGKTSLTLNIARNAAVGQRAKVAIFSLEMTASQLAQRLLAAEARVDSARLRLGQHTEAEERRISRALGVLADAQIFVDDSAVLSVAEMRAKVRRLAMEHEGIDLIILDYLQLMHGGVRTENRVQEISYISRSLKELARELKVPIIAVSQLSRAVETRSPHIPMLSDLRESGSIEQDADVVMFIYREDNYIRREEWERLHPDRPGDSYPEGIAQIIVAKHRNGPTGTVSLKFRDRLASFEETALVDPQYEVAE